MHNKLLVGKSEQTSGILIVDTSKDSYWPVGWYLSVYNESGQLQKDEHNIPAKYSQIFRIDFTSRGRPDKVIGTIELHPDSRGVKIIESSSSGGVVTRLSDKTIKNSSNYAKLQVTSFPAIAYVLFD